MTLIASRIAAAAAAAGVFALDRWSKGMIRTHLTDGDTKAVIPGFFNLVRSENRGVAFSMFDGDASRFHTLILVGFSLAAIGVLAAMLWRIDRQDRLSAAGLSLILGGALGNLYDRVLAGAVTDFLDFYAGSYHWATFNLADSAICVGAGMILLSMLVTNRHQEAKG